LTQIIYIRAVTLKFQFQKDINAHLLNVQLKIAKNSHLIMMANNILANKNVENDDEYKVGITQELIIWDSLPGSLPFNVGSLREYWLHISHRRNKRWQFMFKLLYMMDCYLLY